MKPTTKLLALTAVVGAAATQFSVDYFGTKVRVEAPPPQLAIKRPAQEMYSAKPAHPAPPGQAEPGPALDAYVMALIGDKTLSNQKKFDIFWDGYQKNKTSTVLSTYYIDCLHALTPLPYLDKLLAELSSPATLPEVKNHLMQVMQSAYLGRKGLDGIEKGLDVYDQQRVLHAIKTNIDNTDPNIAGEAVLLYVRMGAQDDLVKILGESLQGQLISPLDYLREGIVQLPNITDAKAQYIFLLTLIRHAQTLDSMDANRVLLQSVNLLVQSPSVLKRIDTASQQQIMEYLRIHEPDVQSEGFDYDPGNAIAYTDWLTSYATLKTRSAANVPGWVTHYLAQRSNDVKKIVAVMSSPLGAEVAQFAHQTEQMDAIKYNVERAMRQLRPGTSAYSAFEAALDIMK